MELEVQKRLTCDHKWVDSIGRLKGAIDKLGGS